MVELFILGGWVMWPILGCSIVAFAIAVDRAVVVLRASPPPAGWIPHLLGRVEAGAVDEALRAASAARGPIPRVLAVGLAAWPLPHEEVERRLERAAEDELAGLEERLPMLATMIAVLPMLGFLGTILGLIEAFMSWSTLGDDVEIEALAGGMYAAMITTAAGLVASIPYVVAHNLLAARIASFARVMNGGASDLAGAHRVLTESRR